MNFLRHTRAKTDNWVVAERFCMHFFITICIYIDDVIIYSQEPQEHANHLREVFERLKDFDLLIQSPKSFFAKDAVEYLGHEVTKEGIKPLEDKTEIVRTWKKPETSSDIRQFLGLCGYYRKFIEKYGQIAKPLSDLTK